MRLIRRSIRRISTRVGHRSPANRGRTPSLDARHTWGGRASPAATAPAAAAARKGSGDSSRERPIEVDFDPPVSRSSSPDDHPPSRLHAVPR